MNCAINVITKYRLYTTIEHQLQWVQDPSQNNVDNLNNVRHEGSRHFRGKKMKANLRARTEELETNSKNKNIRDSYRGINDFKKG
jgi:predicted transposase YbfD/YdcC